MTADTLTLHTALLKIIFNFLLFFCHYQCSYEKKKYKKTFEIILLVVRTARCFARARVSHPIFFTSVVDCSVAACQVSRCQGVHSSPLLTCNLDNISCKYNLHRVGS
jgi:hypothetical protein